MCCRYSLEAHRACNANAQHIFVKNKTNNNLVLFKKAHRSSYFRAINIFLGYFSFTVNTIYFIECNENISNFTSAKFECFHHTR